MMQNKGVEISYFKAWRGRQVALDKLLGSPEESYRILPSYLHMVKQVNKDSITDLVTDSTGRFKYMFLAYGECIDGFRRIRKVISIDGTFLKCKYRGCLLVATAQDGDFRQYPIAWAIVDSENDDSWSWFLHKLKEFIHDDPDLVIISDRHISIINDVRSATTTLTPSTEAILRANFTLSQHLKASQLNAIEYQVFGDGKNEVVNLSDKSCSCRVFQVDKLSCAHAIAAIYRAKLDLYDFCLPYYSSQMWALAYADTIYPVPVSSEWNITDNFRCDVLPPDVKRKRGRAQKERIPLLESLAGSGVKNVVYVMNQAIIEKNAPIDRLICKQVV
ncbi:uncharacterized protein [Henckelia pumila]|uniref:uncharacterized protein n=1 Tax=Henckelia pumila TaxID=405737 RepID=UPI003C6E3EA7